MKTVKGIAFPDADDFMVSEVRDGTYQANHLREAIRYVKCFDCAIDGGAHVGLWTRLLAGSFRKVIAIEPSPDTCEALRWNIASWGIENVETYNVALGRAVGVATMKLDAKNAERRNTGARYAEVGLGGDVSVVTIDSRNLDAVGFIKLDVEGSELAALEGAIRTIRRSQPVILVENKGFGARYFGEPPDAVARFLRARSYGLRTRVGADEIWTR